MIGYLFSAAMFIVGCASDRIELFIAAGIFAVAGAIACKNY